MNYFSIIVALIIGSAIIIATGLNIYFSPYQSCIREAEVERVDRPVVRCIALIGGQ